jgi:hypothetical protein
VHAVPERGTELKMGTWKQAGFGSTPAEVAALEAAVQPRRSTLTPEVRPDAAPPIQLAHADMTALSKTDTNCTALSGASNNW